MLSIPLGYPITCSKRNAGGKQSCCMNLKILQAIRLYRGHINSTEHHVLMIFALFARDDPRAEIFLPLDHIVLQARRSKRTVQRALDGLEGKKLLKPGGMNKGHIRGYSFDVDTLGIDLAPKKRYGKEEYNQTEDEEYRSSVQYDLLGVQPLPEKFRRRREKELEEIRQADQIFRRGLERTDEITSV